MVRIIGKNVLIVAGRKINSFALTLECANHLRQSGSNVYYLDLDIFMFPFSQKKRFRNKILKTMQVKRPTNPTNLTIKNLLLAGKISMIWYASALKSVNAWNFVETTLNLPLNKTVKSLLARSMGSSSFELQECNNNHVYKLTFDTVFAFLQTRSQLDRLSRNFQIDLGVVHGGRDAYSAGAVALFRMRNIQTKLLELGGVSNRWSVFDNSPHYSPDFWQKITETDIANCDQAAIEKWWERRLKGSDHFRSENWQKSREEGSLPSSLPHEFITFFSSSDFEVPIFEDFDIFPDEFKNQFQALKNLSDVAAANSMHVVIRRHPNSVDKFGVDRELHNWNEYIDLPNTTYIGPNEKIDTILLAKLSRIVFTYKSSVGIEAIWLGVPAFALGPARWAWDSSLRAWNKAEIEKVLKVDTPSQKLHATRWAAMMLSIDFECRVFKDITGNYATYRSTLLKNSKISNNCDRLLHRTILVASSITIFVGRMINNAVDIVMNRS